MQKASLNNKGISRTALISINVVDVTKIKLFILIINLFIVFKLPEELIKVLSELYNIKIGFFQGVIVIQSHL